MLTMYEEEKRIAILSVHSCPLGKIGGQDTGGMSIYLRELSRELGKRGFFIDIFTRQHCQEHPYLMELDTNVRLIHLKAGPEKQVEKLQAYHYLNEFTRNLELFRQQFNLDYDIIFSHYWISGVAGKRIQQLWNIPQVMMYHTLGIVKNKLCIGKPEPKLRIKTEKILARDCQAIIAATEQEKEQLIFCYGAEEDKIKVIPGGVNLELFRPHDKRQSRMRLGFNNEKIILFVGRITPIKGIDSLIKAVGYLKNKQGIEGIKLVIIGGDVHSQPLIFKLKKLADDLQLKDAIDFRGLVRQEELPYYYSAADVCSVFSYYESFGLVTLEALACGTPVVGRDVGIMREVIKQKETGWVLNANQSYQELANKLAFFLDDNKVVPAALCRASTIPFGWPNIAYKISQVLSNLPQLTTVLIHES